MLAVFFLAISDAFATLMSFSVNREFIFIENLYPDLKPA